jgi:hypothetical protein
MMPGIAGGDNCDDNFSDNYNYAARESARGDANPRGEAQDKVSRQPAVNLGGHQAFDGGVRLMSAQIFARVLTAIRTGDGQLAACRARAAARRR